jgi:hypothetical protein
MAKDDFQRRQKPRAGLYVGDVASPFTQSLRTFSDIPLCFRAILRTRNTMLLSYGRYFRRLRERPRAGISEHVPKTRVRTCRLISVLLGVGIVVGSRGHDESAERTGDVGNLTVRAVS